MQVYLLYIEDELIGVFESENAARQMAIRQGLSVLNDEDTQKSEIVAEEVRTILDDNLDPWLVWLWRDGSVRDARIVSSLITNGLRPEYEYVKLVRGKNKQGKYSFLSVAVWAKSEQEAITTGKAWVDRYIERGDWKP